MAFTLDCLCLQIDETYLLVSQRERDDCEVQSFTVVASSDAGTGIPSTITESTPLLCELMECLIVESFGTVGSSQCDGDCRISGD